MGNTTCKYICNKDTQNLTLNQGNNINQNRLISVQAFHPTTADINHYNSNSQQIIRIQANYRGHYARKKNKNEIRKIKECKDANSKKKIRPIDVVPDYSNSNSKKAEQMVGPFNYDQPDTPNSKELIDKGPYELDNNAIYIGQWDSKNLRHGKGIQFWVDGSKYEGYWKNDMANGKGRLIHADGDIYEGNWVNDKAEGLGKYIHVDGAIYYGEWKADKQHGKGEERWPDNSNYIGNYDNGKKHGKSKFIWSDGSFYEGDFNNNEISGAGKYYWSDGRNYEGEWRNNKMHGKGIFTWPDGEYMGEYIEDEKEGKGEFIWPDGRKFVGFWKNGKQNGKGTFININQVSKEGEWIDGKRIKWNNDDKNEQTK